MKYSFERGIMSTKSHLSKKHQDLLFKRQKEQVARTQSDENTRYMRQEDKKRKHNPDPLQKGSKSSL